MVLFQLPHRTLQLQGNPDELKKPYEVKLIVELEPKEFFGEADIGERLREFPSNISLTFHGTLFGGMKGIKPKEAVRMPLFKLSQTVPWGAFEIEGSTATLRFITDDINEIVRIAERVIELLPAAFAPISTTSISIHALTGTVNGTPFTVTFEGKVPGGESFSTLGNRQEEIDTYFKELLPIFFKLPRKITSAHRYLCQNYLLQAGSEYSYQFTGERILNLCKALEALLDAEDVNSVKKMRTSLAKWGVHSRFIEVFASLKYLRNELDVAHIASAPISAEAHQRVASFIGTAEKCIQGLIITAVRRFINDPSLYADKKLEIKDPSSIKHLHVHENLGMPASGDLSSVS